MAALDPGVCTPCSISAGSTAPLMAQAPAAAVASKAEGLSFAGCAGVLRPVRGGPTPSFSLKEVLDWLGVPGKNHCSMRRSAMTKGGAEVVDDIHIDGTHVMRLIAAHGRGAAIEAICRLMSTTPPAVPAPGLVPATSEIAAAPEVPPVPAALGSAAVPQAALSLDDGNDAAALPPPDAAAEDDDEPLVPPGDVAGIKTETRQLKRKRDDLEDRILCAICMENDAPRSVLFSPCNHLVACAACAPELKECPLCRAVIKNRIKIANSS